MTYLFKPLYDYSNNLFSLSLLSCTCSPAAWYNAITRSWHLFCCCSRPDTMTLQTCLIHPSTLPVCCSSCFFICAHQDFTFFCGWSHMDTIKKLPPRKKKNKNTIVPIPLLQWIIPTGYCRFLPYINYFCNHKLCSVFIPGFYSECVHTNIPSMHLILFII